MAVMLVSAFQSFLQAPGEEDATGRTLATSTPPFFQTITGEHAVL